MARKTAAQKRQDLANELLLTAQCAGRLAFQPLNVFSARGYRAALAHREEVISQWRDRCVAEGRPIIVFAPTYGTYGEASVEYSHLGHLPRHHEEIARRLLDAAGVYTTVRFHGGHVEFGFSEDSGEFFAALETPASIRLDCQASVFPEVALLLNDLVLDLAR